jgi:dienelactone hydrolase
MYLKSLSTIDKCQLTSGSCLIHPTRAEVAILLLCFLFTFAQGQVVLDSSNLFAVANEFIELLIKEDYSHAVKNFDGAMNTALPVEKLQDIWKSLNALVGSAKKQVSERIEKSGQFQVVIVSYQFEKAVLDIKIVFNSTRQIAGLFFAPGQSSVEYKPPVYVRPNAFREKDVTVQSGKWAMPGTITFPLGDGPFPVLVLVHGSGPNDRDESIGPNKVFRDVAWGLASQGIAVLRYEKRTKVHALKLIPIKDELTVKEETIDDALAAVSLVRKTAGVDTTKIFVLGHSLGGMLIPRIGIRDETICGFIIMAGSSRPLEDVILEQMSYIFSVDSIITEQEKAQLAQMKEQVARLKDPALSIATPAKDLPLGASAKYWLDLRGYHPLEMAKQLKQPILIIQGERDYQVTMEDFKGWKNSLSSRQNIEFKTYPKLNHLFIEGEGKSTPDEYQKVGHVSEAVVSDIAAWIKTH